jgi:peroxiredoxin
MVAVHTVDRTGAPIPFCDITLIERDPGLPSRIKWFRHIGTDEQGLGYCDELAGPFSVDSQRFDFDPWQLAARSQYHHETQIRELATSKNITVTMDDFPTGTCKITGRVHDAAGNALTGFFLSVNRVVGFEIERFVGPLPGDVESHIQRTRVPVMDDDGKFTLDGLAPGDYAIEALDFDVLRHVFLVNKPHVHLAEPGDEAAVDVELEAREARYGRAIFGNDKPVTHGYWIAPFNQPATAWRGHSMNFMSDGSFRVLLSKSEREGIRENAKGMIEFHSRDKGIQAKKAAKAEIRFDDLSSDPLRPTKVVLRERDEMPAAVAAPLKPKQKWKLALGDSPDFKLVDTKGQTRRLADYRGKVVWLNVFGTSCAPCLEEWPRLVELSQQHGAEGLVVLAICPQPAKEVEEFARLRSPPFPVLVDEHQDAVARIINPGLLVLPSNLLIDRDGRIAHLSEDFTDEEFAELTAKARKLLTREP